MTLIEVGRHTLWMTTFQGPWCWRTKGKMDLSTSVHLSVFLLPDKKNNVNSYFLPLLL